MKRAVMMKYFVFSIIAIITFYSFNLNQEVPDEIDMTPFTGIEYDAVMEPITVPTEPMISLEELENYDEIISSNIEDPEVECIAKNMWFEARNEGTAGVYAVTNVVFNRMDSEKYPQTACDVIEQAKYSTWWLKEKGKLVPIKNMCQFSWYCDGKSDEVSRKEGLYADLVNLANYMLVNKSTILDITDGATFYHADYVKPKWRLSKHRTVIIGRHIFYKE